jgi:hypothetical protein
MASGQVDNPLWIVVKRSVPKNNFSRTTEQDLDWQQPLPATGCQCGILTSESLGLLHEKKSLKNTKKMAEILRIQPQMLNHLSPPFHGAVRNLPIRRA